MKNYNGNHNPSKDGYAKVFFEKSYTRRKKNHDYHAPAIYHIILKKTTSCVPFGMPAGDARIRPGEEGCATIIRTPLGNIIQKELHNLSVTYPFITIYQFIVMPDHIHILLHIKENTEKALGYYIGRLKATITAKWLGEGRSAIEIFQKNFTDKIIHPGRSLDDIIRYIKENPHRLAIRQFYPDFFRRIRNFSINGEELQAFGNLFLLRHPFKRQVVVHRADSEADKEAQRKELLFHAAGGDVLVSPFISRAEKEIRSEAENLGARIILIQDEPFRERFKPAAHDFHLCEEGRLLIIAPVKPWATTLTREICLRMNAIAETISHTQPD